MTKPIGRLSAMAVAFGALIMASTASADPAIDRSVRVAPGGLYQLVFNPADNDVYVAATGPRGANAAVIARVNGTTLAPDPSLSVGENPLYGLGINTRTQTLYGTATRNGTVGVIDIATGEVSSISDGDPSAHVREVVVDEQRNKIYITVVGGGVDDADRPNQVWVIDGATNTLERKITVPIGGLTGAALDVARNRIFVTGMSSNEVVAVDLSNDQVVGRFPTTSETPINVAYDAAGNRLFVASQGSGDLTVLNAANGAVLSKIATGAGALGVAYNPAVGQVYVSNRQAGTVTVIDTVTYAILANLETGTLPQTIVIDPATNAVYVTNKARGTPRNAPAGTPPVEDTNGDTVTIIRP